MKQASGHKGHSVEGRFTVAFFFQIDLKGILSNVPFKHILVFI